MPETKIYGEGWSATVLTGPSRDGWYQVYCTTLGESGEKALEGAAYILNAFAFGRVALIRVRPEAASDKDFDTKEVHHKGVVRFMYRLDAGDWQYAEPTMTLRIGDAA